MTEENTTQTPKDLRDALERAEARATEAEKTAQAATSDLRRFQATVTFEKNGLTPKHAELFLKANPEAEVTPEAVSDFAHEYGLATGEPEPSGKKEETPPANEGLNTFGEAAGSGTAGSTPAAQPQMSQEDFESLLATNPDEAAKAYAEGRVSRNSLNVQARDLVNKGIIDH